MVKSRKGSSPLKLCGKFAAYARAAGLIALGTYVALVCWDSHRKHADHFDFFPSATDVLAKSNRQLGDKDTSTALRGSEKSTVQQMSGSVAVAPQAAQEDAAQEESFGAPAFDPSLDASPRAEDAVPPLVQDTPADGAEVHVDSQTKNGWLDLLKKSGVSKVCKSVKIESAGKEDGNKANFWLGDQQINSPPSGRGLNVVTIDLITQEVIEKKHYDIWESPESKEQLGADIEQLLPGTVVLMGAMDSGLENLDSSMFEIFREQLGAKISAGTFREGYALIAVKGGGPAIAEEQGLSANAAGELPCNGAMPKPPKPTVAVALESNSEESKSDDPVGCTQFQVKVQSAGKDAGNMANFFINGKILRTKKPSSRGMNVVTLDPRNGKVMWKRAYDVWEEVDAANEKLFDDLESVPQGTIVLAAAMDSGMEHLDSYALDALQSCGASITEGKFRTGYALIGVKDGKKVAEKMAPHAEVSGTPECPSADYGEKSPATGADLPISDEVLFVVVSDSMFYNTRVKWILDTWGKDVPEGDLMVVADKKTDVHVATRLEETPCAKGSHDAGCCKYAHAVFIASERLKEVGNLEWFYFADDDVYVRPDALKKRLVKRRISKWPVAKGLLGCANDAPGCSGICGGGGFLLNRMGLLKLVEGHTRESFVKLYMKSCAHCDHWGDLAVSKMIKDSHVKLENIKGLHPWRLGKPQFIDQLRSAYPPVTLHYMRNAQQLQFLYKMFSPSQQKPTEETKDSKKISGDKSFACLIYHGQKVCARSGGDTDVPWR